jgi:hypothetical protein
MRGLCDRVSAASRICRVGDGPASGRGVVERLYRPTCDRPLVAKFTLGKVPCRVPRAQNRATSPRDPAAAPAVARTAAVTDANQRDGLTLATRFARRPMIALTCFNLATFIGKRPRARRLDRGPIPGPSRRSAKSNDEKIVLTKGYHRAVMKGLPGGQQRPQR